MKLVQFVDGTYGVRKFSIWVLGWVYKDLAGLGYVNTHWWSDDEPCFYDCSTSKERAIAYINRSKHKVVPL